jgi:hypothetical protein
VAAVALILRLGLAVVFAVAGATKLADPRGARRALEEFGVPRSATSHIARLLPAVELVTAAGLLARASAPWAAAGAFLLLGLFTTAIARALARGPAPDCHCFGRLHSSRAGPSTLARNAALMAAAGLVLAQGFVRSPTDPIGWLSGLGPGPRVGLLVGIPAAVAIGLLTWSCFVLLRRYGRLLVRFDEREEVIAAGGGGAVAEPGPPVMERAPGFDAADLNGSREELDSILDPPRLSLMVFADLACGPCRELLPQVARWQDDHAQRLLVAVVTSGDAEDASELRERYGIERVLLQREHEIAAAYNLTGTPAALLLYGDGRVARPVALGATQIERLVNEAATSPTSMAPTRAKAAAVAAGAGAAVMATSGAAVAQSTPPLTSSDPEVQQINNLIMAAQPQLASAIQATQAPLRMLGRRDRLRVSQKVKRRRLRSAESKLRADSQLLGQLRVRVLALPLSGARGKQAQQVVADMIDLHINYFERIAQSLRTRRPKHRIRQANQAKQLLVRALHRSVDAEFVLTR